MKVKQHGGHAEPEQPKGRRIRCRVLGVSSGFIHGDGSVPKQRATTQEGMASPVRSISCSGVLWAPRNRQTDRQSQTAATAHFSTISLVGAPPLKLWSKFVYDSARLYRRWCRYRWSERMRRDSQIRQARLCHTCRRGSIPTLQALDPFEGLYTRKGNESEKDPGTR